VLDLINPKAHIGLGTRFSTTVMPVPVTAMHEDSHTVAGENNIGFSWKSAIVKAEAKAFVK